MAPEEAAFAYREQLDQRNSRNSAQQSSDGTLWTLGAVFFFAGFVVGDLSEYYINHGTLADWIATRIVYGLLQAVGLLLMAIADVDVNVFLSCRPLHVLLFAVRARLCVSPLLLEQTSG